MKKLILFAILLCSTIAYAQIPHKTRSTLQIDIVDSVTRVDSLLILNDDKIVEFISYLDFVAQLEATGISGGGGSGDPTNISIIHSPTTGQVISSTGTNGLLELATNTNSGLLSPTDKAKLDGLTNFDPSNYARKDIAETFASSVTVTDGLRLGNQNNYGSLSWYGGSGGAVRVTAIFDEATKNLKFTNYEAGGNYVFDGSVTVSAPLSGLHATNIEYNEANLAGVTNTDAFTPTADYHPATKKYVDDEVLAGGGYNDEAAQDAVGSILVDGSNFNFTYNDGIPSITGEVIEANLTITESQISDFGSYAELSGDNLWSADNQFAQLIINTVTNGEIDAGAANVLITKDWYNNNLYHTANNITNTPSGNLIATDVQGALNEIQTEVDGFTVTPFNEHFPIASDYTTLFANKDQKGIISSGNIILDDADAGIVAEYQIQFLNSKGSDVTISLGPSQQTKQFGTGVIPSIANNQYAYLELISDNIWSIIVGKDSQSGGVSDHTLLTSIGANTHAQIDTHLADATTHFTEASISITESQVSDLSHTINTNTQLSQTQVGTYATNEGFIKTFVESDPYWNGEEANVPRLNASNIYTSNNTFEANNFFTGTNNEIANLDIIANTSNDSQVTFRDQYDTGRLTFGFDGGNLINLINASGYDFHIKTNNHTLFIDNGSNHTEITRLDVFGDPIDANGVGNQGYNDARYYEIITNPPVDGYVFSSTASGVTSWVPNGAAGGGGDVSQYGTVTDNQLAVWRGANLVEGVAGLTFDDSTNELRASNQYFGDFQELRFGGRMEISSYSGSTSFNLLSGNLIYRNNGTQIAALNGTTGVFYTTATNSELNASGTNLITKSYGDAFYGPLAAVALNTAKTSNASHTGDVAGSTTLAIQDGRVDEAHLNASNSPVDEYFLTYEASTNNFQWQPGLSGGGMDNLVEDATPQLGGTLNSNGNDIVFDNNYESIGNGQYGVDAANTGYMYWYNNRTTIKSYDDVASNEYGEVYFEYINASNTFESRWSESNNSPDFGTFSYDGFYDRFEINSALGGLVIYGPLDVGGVLSGYNLDIERKNTSEAISSLMMGKTIFGDNTSVMTYTVPDTLSLGTDGSWFEVVNEGTGSITVNFTGDCFINDQAAGQIVIPGRVGSKVNHVRFIQRDAFSDNWTAIGDY